MKHAFRWRLISLCTCLCLAAALWLPTPAKSVEVQLTREEQDAIEQTSVFSRAFVAVAKLIRPAVVNIKVERRVTVTGFNDAFDFFSQMFGPRFPGRPLPETRSQTKIELGSGVIIDDNGIILTNNHVVGQADAIRVQLLDGREYTAELIGTDPSSDVAVIKIDADNLVAAKMGDSDLVEVGEWVMAVGNPFGFDSTVTTGIISARGRSGMGLVEVEDFIQTDASINPGNSGGALVNLRGELIGINSMIFSPSGANNGIGFAIPSNMAKNIMLSLIAHKQVTVSYLGVETQPLTQELAHAFGLAAPRGALIGAVTKGSPAETAGLRRGDVVVRWGRREIADDQQFKNLVTITPPGEQVEVEVVREGQTSLLQVTLVPLPPEAAIEGRSDRFLQSLGITVADLSQPILEELGYEPDAEGVLITSVERGSPADRLGMVGGSILLSINGQNLLSQQDLKTLVGSSTRSDVYDLVWRTGRYVQRARLRGN